MTALVWPIAKSAVVEVAGESISDEATQTLMQCWPPSQWGQWSPVIDRGCSGTVARSPAHVLHWCAMRLFPHRLRAHLHLMLQRSVSSRLRVIAIDVLHGIKGCAVPVTALPRCRSGALCSPKRALMRLSAATAPCYNRSHQEKLDCKPPRATNAQVGLQFTLAKPIQLCRCRQERSMSTATDAASSH